MRLTNERLKQIIKEELENVLNEGALAYVKQQLNAAGAAASYNDWLKSFQRVNYLSGPEDSLTNWISQAETSKDPQAKEALNKIRQLMKQHKESEMAETTLSEQDDEITGFLILEEEKMSLKVKGQNKQISGSYKQFGLRAQDIDKLAAGKDKLLKTVPGAVTHLSQFFDVGEEVLQNFEIVHGYSFNTTTYREKAGVVTADR
tara:strand:- start:106 stop:714 length:609 start_codon:yes stop_codon:yes gene_type:complete